MSAQAGRRAWTTTEARIAKHERARETPVRDIADRLGRSEHSVYAFLRYQHRGKAYAEALQRPCPQCAAMPGQPCLRRTPKSGGHRLRKLAHAERFAS